MLNQPRPHSPNLGAVRKPHAVRAQLVSLRESYEGTRAAAVGADLLVSNMAAYATEIVNKLRPRFAPKPSSMWCGGIGGQCGHCGHTVGDWRSNDFGVDTSHQTTAEGLIGVYDSSQLLPFGVDQVPYRVK